MMQFRNLLALSTIALTTPTVPASANSLCDRISEPHQRFYCQGQQAVTQAQQARIRSYSPRQHYLAQAVSQLVNTYYQQTGQVLPVTSQTVTQMMQLIGATNMEAAFVVDRMVANTRAIAALQEFGTCK